jgi:hypothetical protein
MCQLKYLIRDWKLVSSGVFLGWVDVFSGGLEVDEYLSKNVIRSKPLLGGVCFSIFIGDPLIYVAFVLYLLFYGYLFVLCKDLIFINIIFAVKKRKETNSYESRFATAWVNLKIKTINLLISKFLVVVT